MAGFIINAVVAFIIAWAIMRHDIRFDLRQLARGEPTAASLPPGVSALGALFALMLMIQSVAMGLALDSLLVRHLVIVAVFFAFMAKTEARIAKEKKMMARR